MQAAAEHGHSPGGRTQWARQERAHLAGVRCWGRKRTGEAGAGAEPAHRGNELEQESRGHGEPGKRFNLVSDPVFHTQQGGREETLRDGAHVWREIK